MPRFHFELSCGLGTDSRLQSTVNDLPDTTHAIAHAEQLARDMLAEADKRRHYIDHDIFRVTDAAGRVVLSLPILDLVEPQRSRQPLPAVAARL